MNKHCSIGHTALIEAFNFDCIRVLLGAGAHVNIYSNIGYNALKSCLLRHSNNKEMLKLLYVAGESTEHLSSDARMTIPDDITQMLSPEINLMDLCRHAIRKHLMHVEPHLHLFCQVPELGLPSVMQSYLLYGMSLNSKEDDDDDDDTYYNNNNDADDDDSDDNDNVDSNNDDGDGDDDDRNNIDDDDDDDDDDDIDGTD